MSEEHEIVAKSLQSEIYRRMAPALKWQEAEKLRAVAWELKRCAVRSAHPDWSDLEVERKVREIFLYATT